MYGTCFDESRLEVVAVVGLLWIYWCFLDWADVVFFGLGGRVRVRFL